MQTIAGRGDAGILAFIRRGRCVSFHTVKILSLALLAACILTMSDAYGQTITVLNKLANGYATNPFSSVEGCPSGYTVSNIPSGYHIERPHVIFNSSTNQWVLWAHYDNSNYTTAEALVATSANQCGPYTIFQEFQPMGKQIRDDFLFQDTNGTAYFIAASNKNGGANDTMAIFQLTSDYLNVNTTAGMAWVMENQYREAPVVLKSGSTYFLLSSQAAGWFPSQGGYTTSTSMLSGWAATSNLGNASTFGGQNADLLTFAGTSGTAYILVMDHLGGNTARDDGALWLPLQINASAGTATLEWYDYYTVDTAKGTLGLPSRVDLATTTATASSTGTGCSAASAADQNYATEWCASGNTFPSWWQTDLGSVTNVDEVDISWWMYKGSEAYYQYQIQYSSDGQNWTTIDRTNNTMYGFTNDRISFTGRYVRINITNAVLQNNPNNWYTPAIWEVKLFANTTNVLAGVPLRLISLSNNLCLDVSNASTSNGGAIDTYTCNGQQNQNWFFTPTGSQYEVSGQQSGLALEDPGSNKQVGHALDQWTWNGGANQTWSLSSQGLGIYTLTNLVDGLCADVYNAAQTSGATVDQWTCNGNSNQQWRLAY